MAANQRRVAGRKSVTSRAKSKPYRLGERKPLEPAPPFTVELVTRDVGNALRGDKNMRSAGPMPDLNEIQRLTAALNKLHSLCFAAQEVRDKAKNRPQAKDLFSKLRKILPEVEEYGRAESEHAPPFLITNIDRCARALRDLLSCEQLAVGLHTQSIPYQMSGWQSCAKALYGHLTNLMGVTAMARFIAAVTPTLTGENPTPTSVKTWLIKNCR